MQEQLSFGFQAMTKKKPGKYCGFKVKYPKNTPRRKRDKVLTLLEKTRVNYIAKARQTAVQLSESGRILVTVNDVRALCPPPGDVDPRVMGSIFNTPEWEPAGFVNSDRTTCHARPIRQFRYIG